MIAALTRFVSRRGKPHTVYSDNGTNFKGAYNELFRICSDQNYLDFCANECIRWKFMPPHAAHFGGLWEAGVKAVKAPLNKTMGNMIFNYEEFYTLLTRIEACLNSRPITPLSTDPQDYAALTPGHFLIGRSLIALPEEDISKEKIPPTKRWKLLEQVTQHFWQRWHRDYLNELQQRYKWTESEENIKINDFVVLKEDNLPPTKWLMGRVISVFPGKDGLVRVAEVRTTTGVYKRPISKLILLHMIY